MTKGSHELHFGGEIVRISNHIINTFLQNGYFQFDGHFTGDGLAKFSLAMHPVSDKAEENIRICAEPSGGFSLKTTGESTKD